MTDHKMPMLIGEVSVGTDKPLDVSRANYGNISDHWAQGGFLADGASYNKGIGIRYWAYWGGDNADLTTGGNGGGHNIQLADGVPTNLTEEGKMVWADVRRANKEWAAPCGGAAKNPIRNG